MKTTLLASVLLTGWAAAIHAAEWHVAPTGKDDNPVAVRYAWANNPLCNLYNQAV